MTIVVPETDVLGHALTRRFDLNSLRRETDDDIQTSNYSQEVSDTPEVRTPVAVGLTMEETRRGGLTASPEKRRCDFRYIP
jgi:hypothetical protein